MSKFNELLSLIPVIVIIILFIFVCISIFIQPFLGARKISSEFKTEKIIYSGWAMFLGGDGNKLFLWSDWGKIVVTAEGVHYRSIGWWNSFSIDFPRVISVERVRWHNFRVGIIKPLLKITFEKGGEPACVALRVWSPLKLKTIIESKAKTTLGHERDKG